MQLNKTKMHSAEIEITPRTAAVAPSTQGTTSVTTMFPPPKQPPQNAFLNSIYRVLVLQVCGESENSLQIAIIKFYTCTLYEARYQLNTLAPLE